MVGDLGLTGIGLVCCLACVFILPCFIWLIWGGIILDNAHGLRSEGTCRADQFWWHCASAFISVGVFALLQCCQQMAAKSPADGTLGGSSRKTLAQHILAVNNTCDLLIAILRLVYMLAFAVFGVVLWESLGHEPQSIKPVYQDCSDWFKHFDSDYDDFLTLWKITTIFNFVVTILVVVAATYSIVCMRKKEPEPTLDEIHAQNTFSTFAPIANYQPNYGGTSQVVTPPKFDNQYTAVGPADNRHPAL